MNKKRLSKNLIITLLSYTFLLVLNIWVSKLILVGYGSETNGLLASVNQIFSYIALLEAGIGTATITALYGPLSKNDADDVNQICSASVAYYRIILRWYIVCVIAVSFVWPFLLDTTIDYWTIFSVIFIQGISNALTFYFVSATTNYLLAAGKNYINTYIHLAITLLTYIAKALVVVLGGKVIFISLALLGVNIVKCICYWLYKQIKCKKIKFNLKADRTLLKQRKFFLVHEIVGCIFASTDLIIISIFCDLKLASVYAVYSMVISAIGAIIGQTFSSTQYILGDAYQKNHYENTHDKFNAIYITIVFALYTITYLLFAPFINIYTSGINDINYVSKGLPLLFILIQLLSVCRNVDTVLIKNALHAEQTINRAIIEAVINLSVSILLVNFIGIYGVLLGTIVALLYRSNDMIIYANKKILNRSPWKEYKLHAFNFLIFGMFLIFNDCFPIYASGYVQLLYKAVIVSLLCVGIYSILNFLMFCIAKKR